ncbi:MAG: hypothetical protein ABJH52_17245 [Henriciella sp.]
MNEDDRKRLEREADIAKATRGPDYSRLEGDIAKTKAEAQKRTEASQETEAQRQYGLSLVQWMKYVTIESPYSTPTNAKSNDRDR